MFLMIQDKFSVRNDKSVWHRIAFDTSQDIEGDKTFVQKRVKMEFNCRNLIVVAVLHYWNSLSFSDSFPSLEQTTHWEKYPHKIYECISVLNFVHTFTLKQEYFPGYTSPFLVQSPWYSYKTHVHLLSHCAL